MIAFLISLLGAVIYMASMLGEDLKLKQRIEKKYQTTLFTKMSHTVSIHLAMLGGMVGIGLMLYGVYLQPRPPFYICIATVVICIIVSTYFFLQKVLHRYDKFKVDSSNVEQQNS